MRTTWLFRVTPVAAVLVSVAVPRSITEIACAVDWWLTTASAPSALMSAASGPAATVGIVAIVAPLVRSYSVTRSPPRSGRTTVRLSLDTANWV